jgi:peptide/nickel transport system permease protein
VREYAIKRFFQAIPLILVVMTFNFFIIHAAPGDPVTYMYGPYSVTGEDMERLRESLGLNRPLIIQYLSYLADLLRGDLGYSAINRKPVLNLIVERIPATLILMISGLIFSVLLGIFLGAICAIRVRSKIDYLVSAVSLIGYCMPVFWFGIILILLFSLRLQIFPSMGMISLGKDLHGFAGFLDLLHHLALPTVALGTYYMATYTRLTRSSMLEVLSQDYIKTAWAKGLASKNVYFRHALQNALLPVVTVMGLQIGFMFAGAVLTETVFAWPGMGRLTYNAILQRDYPLLMGLFVLVCICVIFANLLTDIVYAYLDPRIQYRSK